jgi:hypothetical protein
MGAATIGRIDPNEIIGPSLNQKSQQSVAKS